MFDLLQQLVVAVSFINILRMSLFLIGSDIYGVRHHFAKKKQRGYLPHVNVVIPAYNESKTIIATVRSVLASDYPKDNFHVIVVDDGSKDATRKIISEFIIAQNSPHVTLITKENGGKASALNTGICANRDSELIMCLDADAYLSPRAIRNAVSYFYDAQVVAMAANVKIERTKGIINLVQVFEYVVAYQMKKALTQYNIEYIIGGIGSMFRRSALEEVGYYDEDTVTEDIDLTMKLLQFGNKKRRIIYGSDVVAFTQSAGSVADLITQRFRWKWGRYQTFYKNTNLFFSLHPDLSKPLTWIYLPYALLSDMLFFLEPLIITYMLAVVIISHDYMVLFLSTLIMSVYLGLNILAENTIPRLQKIEMLFLTPLMYYFLYILSFVEYFILISSWLKLPGLRTSIGKGQSSWQSVERMKFME